MSILPTIVYVDSSSGSIPNLHWYQKHDPDITKKLQISHDLDQLTQHSVDQKVWLGKVHALGDVECIPWQGFSKWICHVGEPARNFGDFWQVMDRPNVDVVMTGSPNFSFAHARLHRIETFFGEIRQLYKHLRDDLRKPNRTSKPFYFDALLGTASRLPRSWIKEQLESRHPGKNIVRVYPSYPPNPYLFRHVVDDHYLWPEGTDFTGLEDQPFFAAQMVKYKGIPAMICLILPWNVYEQTAYSIVAETQVDNAWNFYTEKTAKPIMARRLFVAFAGQYHLRNLRSLGFRTFDGIIDESYDLESDPTRRWEMAMQQVDFLCGQDQVMIFDQIQDIVEHNFQLMNNTNWNQQINDTLINCILDKN